MPQPVLPLPPSHTPPARALTPQRALDAAAFLILGLSLWLPSGYSLGALLLLALGLAAAPAWLRNARSAIAAPAAQGMAAWAAVIVCMALVWAMHTVPAEGGWPPAQALDRSGKYLLVLLALLALWWRSPQPQALRWGCWLGAAGAGLLGLWQVLALGEHRAFGHTNAIQFGNLALLLGLYSALWAMSDTDARPRGRATAWGWVAAALGLLGSLVSGSRGGWLAMPFLLLLLCMQVRPGQRLRVLAGGMAVTVLMLALPPVQERIHKAVTEYETQRLRMDDSSVGLRMSFWALAWRLGQSHPLTGVGQHGYEQAQRQAIAARTMPEGAVHFEHAHNEWLDMFAKRGLLGAAGLALLYGVPAWLLARRLPRLPHGPARTSALCGLATVLGFALFGLTQVVFAHNSGNLMYLLCISLWLASSREAPLGSSEKQPRKHAPIQTQLSKQ